MENNKRIVYFISDRTGITSENLGEALLIQFENVEFQKKTYPFIDTKKKARLLIKDIEKESSLHSVNRPIIFSSIVDREIRNLIKKCDGFHIDFYDTFIHSLEDELKVTASYNIGKLHAIDNQGNYDKRIDAVNFALNYDDGVFGKDLDNSDVILVGVSRSGKTPTCLYLALQYGIKAANYPLTPDDLGNFKIPKALSPYLNKLFGLTINSDRLHNIRSKRRPDSVYASLNNCKKEIKAAELLFKMYQIPFLNSTHTSVEELSASILQKADIRRSF